jgi:hypothetical protein
VCDAIGNIAGVEHENRKRRLRMTRCQRFMQNGSHSKVVAGSYREKMNRSNHLRRNATFFQGLHDLPAIAGAKTGSRPLRSQCLCTPLDFPAAKTGT